MKILASLILGTACLLAGCANTINTLERADPQARPNYVRDHRVITDSRLERGLEIVSINEAYVSGDLLKIQVTVTNTSSSPRSFNYAFEWIAEDGMQVNSPRGWKTIRLAAKETTAISAVSTSPQATDFRLKIMRPGF